ncbi:hypothetical protein D9619_010153 [Psilocybe cf. subviscida]|uniref:Uncharacterized protein n=1 Tax=Psilocybe cf. subviscida TaxID=2480587 RepID=A0A8H5ES05_9AGAR|nr:hypothetical protein D9619_010153 [Psilocybe cf. subviscida]
MGRVRFKALQDAHRDSGVVRQMDSTDEIEMLNRKQREEDTAGFTTSMGRGIAPTSRASTAFRTRVVPTKSELVKEKRRTRSQTPCISRLSKWRHAKVLVGTFYGIDLNQNVVPQQIGFDSSSGTPWKRHFKASNGNLTITALGSVPGVLRHRSHHQGSGQKNNPDHGFIFLTALFLEIQAGGTACFHPAKIFPTRLKAFVHDISAVVGRAGAVIIVLAFNAQRLVEKCHLMDQITYWTNVM